MRVVRALVALIGLCLVAACIVGALFVSAVYGDKSRPAQSVNVTIERGSTFADVAQQLQRNGIIGNALAFRILARLRHADVDIHAGSYTFAPHQSASGVLDALMNKGAQVAAWVSIPEGFTADQIAQTLQESGLGNQAAFEQYFKHNAIAIDGSTVYGLEGYLFPDTYLVPLGATPAAVAQIFTGQFLKELPQNAPQRARALGFTVPQTVIVASLVEREAKIDADRPMIAGVIYNRLRKGMPLQVDATIEYALPQHKSELSFGDLKIDSPYNSYTHPGLPPTPIANPGLPSLQAALNPSKTDALYYVYCGNGHHVFARTLAEHQANVARCLH